jgi:hypothetical protein
MGTSLSQKITKASKRGIESYFTKKYKKNYIISLKNAERDLTIIEIHGDGNPVKISIKISKKTGSYPYEYEYKHDGENDKSVSCDLPFNYEYNYKRTKTVTQELNTRRYDELLINIKFERLMPMLQEYNILLEPYQKLYDNYTVKICKVKKIDLFLYGKNKKDIFMIKAIF